MENAITIGQISGIVMGIVADMFAMFPTINFTRKNPSEDRPMMWIVFSVGYIISMFSITEHTFSNYILPIYMFVGAGYVGYVLVVYRIKHNIPLREWI